MADNQENEANNEPEIPDLEPPEIDDLEVLPPPENILRIE
jgi:hypothetical protein